jgi:putative transposase
MARRGRANLIDESFFCVTTTVVRWANVFSNEQCCDLLVRNIKYYQLRYKFAILGYVIMPSHFHWVVEVNPTLGTISDIMRDIKKYSAWDIMEELERQGRDDLLTLFRCEAEGYSDKKRRFWTERFDDEVIRNQQMLCAKIAYIHNNPVKAGLVDRAEEYKYSSARNYVLDDHSVLFVDTEWAG